MRIKKVKIGKNGKNLFAFEKQNDKSGWDEFSMNCEDAPAPSLIKAMADLREFVSEMCEISDTPENLKVTGVSFSYSEEKEVMGTVITAQKKLFNSSAPLNLNTPHKIEEYYSDKGDPKQLLPPKSIKALNNLIKEAKKYINGHRAQTSLFDPDSPVKNLLET